MTSTPYLPDEARARMPNSAMQPLPPYLRPDFSQSLDRSRPHELLIPELKGKPQDPSRMGNLTYRYLDTDETVTVPNIWYNQTVAMRLSWWEFEVRRTEQQLAQVRAELAAAEACTAPYYRGEKTESARRALRWSVEERERLALTVKGVLADVKAGIRFL